MPLGVVVESSIRSSKQYKLFKLLKNALKLMPSCHLDTKFRREMYSGGSWDSLV